VLSFQEIKRIQLFTQFKSGHPIVVKLYSIMDSGNHDTSRGNE